MAEKPILFNTEMVKAILDSKKTQTRRVVKPQPPNNESLVWEKTGGAKHCGFFAQKDNEFESYKEVKSPYKVGDILWVRETWCEVPYETICVPIENGMMSFPKIAYKADSTIDYTGIWRPSIHMPREAARIFLKVTGVRAERLQDITEEDILKEGIINNCMVCNCKNNFSECDTCHKQNNIVFDYASLWDSTLPKPTNKFKRNINSWEDNPWVWVIEFERLRKERLERDNF